MVSFVCQAWRNYAGDRIAPVNSVDGSDFSLPLIFQHLNVLLLLFWNEAHQLSQMCSLTPILKWSVSTLPNVFSYSYSEMKCINSLKCVLLLLFWNEVYQLSQMCSLTPILKWSVPTLSNVFSYSYSEMKCINSLKCVLLLLFWNEVYQLSQMCSLTPILKWGVSTLPNVFSYSYSEMKCTNSLKCVLLLLFWNEVYQLSQMCSLTPILKWSVSTLPNENRIQVVCSSIDTTHSQSISILWAWRITSCSIIYARNLTSQRTSMMIEM